VLHIPWKTAIDYDINLPPEKTQSSHSQRANYCFIIARCWPLPVTRQLQKSNSQYRPFRVVIFLTRSQSPPDPQETLDPDLGTAAYPWKADGRILAC